MLVQSVLSEAQTEENRVTATVPKKNFHYGDEAILICGTCSHLCS